MEKFDHLKIKMEDIISATNNFSRTNFIGGGGFGPVYKGELSLPMGSTTVAFKRLDPRHGQGNTEFWKEITMLFESKHENLVSLIHFCINGDERVLVYEYASRGSLDRYLSDARLTWNQRLHICIGAARAIKYLHDPNKSQGMVLHRDIKSSNILLDDKWTPKVSDFGLSKIGPAYQQNTVVISNPVGTLGYCDPLYSEMGFLSKESDVYSFGVVLFEVMCGRLCSEYRNGELVGILVHKWKECCNEKKLDDIIFQDLKEQIHKDSLTTFSTIAKRCLERNRKERPTMDEIVKVLEVALAQNINHDVDLVKILNRESYRSEKELILLLSKGILVDEGKRWVSINKKEDIQEMISATQCIHGMGLKRFTLHNSRFWGVLKDPSLFGFKVEVRTRFLLPNVTYTINLVFKDSDNGNGTYVPFQYKLDTETHYSKSCIVHVREDGWLMAELYRFTSYQKEHEFTIKFLPFNTKESVHYFEGIEFRAIEREAHENLEDRNKGEMQHKSNISHMDWEQKLSLEYIDLIKSSKDDIKWTTKKELYSLVRKGFHINSGESAAPYFWLSIDKNMKKRLMVPARAIFIKERWIIWKSLQESRYNEVAEFDQLRFAIDFRLNTELVSPNTSYSCYLIYKLPEDYYFLDDDIKIYTDSNIRGRYFYLVPPRPTPLVGSIVDQKCDSPSYTRKFKGHPKLRKDGWMQLPLLEFSTNTIKPVQIKVDIRSCFLTKFTGIVIQGIEFKPS